MLLGSRLGISSDGPVSRPETPPDWRTISDGVRNENLGERASAGAQSETPEREIASVPPETSPIPCLVVYILLLQLTPSPHTVLMLDPVGSRPIP